MLFPLRSRPAAFIILGAFVAAALVGLLIGASAALHEAARGDAPHAPTAGQDGDGSSVLTGPPPTEAEYKTATAAAVASFVAAPSAETAAAASAALSGHRVPAAFREPHLALVLLLDRWTRTPDREALDRLLAEQPWLITE